MNEKLYAVAEKLTIRLARFTGVTLQEGELGPGGIRALDQELYADFDELRRERAKTDDEIDAYIARRSRPRSSLGTSATSGTAS